MWLKDYKSARHQAWEPPVDTKLWQKDAKETAHQEKTEPIP